MLRHLLPAGRLKMRYMLAHESGKPTWEQSLSKGLGQSAHIGGKILGEGARQLNAGRNKPWRAATKLDHAIGSGAFEPDQKTIGQAIVEAGKNIRKNIKDRKTPMKEKFTASDASIKYRRNRRLNRR